MYSFTRCKVTEMSRRLLIWVVFVVTGAVLWLFASCNSPVSNNTGPDITSMISGKPEVDSSKILSTLELYRAKRYSDLPAALADPVENVHKLVLHGQKLGVLPAEIGQLIYLSTFDVAFNELSGLPDEMSKLHYLRGFYANGNRLTQFPEQVLLLPLLNRLDLSENQIPEIPVEIEVMYQLVRLTMDRNHITRLPVEIYKLNHLEILELKENGLSKIPEGISNLTGLKKLDLAQNRLTTLPKEITTMTLHLEDLNIQGNPISSEEIAWLQEAMPSTRIRY